MNGNYPVITLTNGLRVMNFNSPHAFNFIDGCVLPAVPNNIALETQLDFEDVYHQESITPAWYSVEKKFKMSTACHFRMNQCEMVAALEKVDIILVPLPVLVLMKEMGHNTKLYRTIYVVDRITKEISNNTFCI
jgi:hypothetical protein